MNLDELRKRINEVDLNIIEALSERRKLSKEIIQAKDISEKPIRDRKREEELLSILISEGKKQGLDSHYISKLFYEIIEDSLRIQQSYIHGVISDSGKTSKSIKVAIQGIEGSYSFLASKKFFTHYQGDEFFLKKDTFKEVIQSVEKGEADFAFLPVENTTSGSINEVYDLLLHTTLSIIGEEKFQVKHCLVASTDIPLHKIKKIYAHYQAAAQCEIFLSTLPDCKVEYFKDTAMSVKKIKEEGIKHHAAIASEEAAQLFNVKIVKTGIANQEENFTRFVVCARKPVNVDQRIPSKTSLVMATSQTPGALSDALLVMKKYNLNMTKLESRPIIGNPWEEMFYVDFAGNVADEKVQEALDELGQFSRFLKILGSYPTQDIPRIKLDFVSADSEKIPEVAEGKIEPKQIKLPIQFQQINQVINSLAENTKRKILLSK